MRILAALQAGRVHVSQLARDVRLSRPLVHMQLQRLEAAGLVSGHP
jgi:DNA-binding MarR family transcriptional regulator